MLKEKIILITGASRGIGQATALLAAKNGASVVVNYNKSERDAYGLVDLIRKSEPDDIVQASLFPASI